MPKVAIIYASGLGRTKQMAGAIADGAKTIEDVKDADAILLGGSTYNYKLIRAMDPFLDKMKGLDLKGKVGMVFGSYGWSGESIPTLTKRMKSFGMNVIEPGITAIQVPDAAVIEKSFKTGRTVAQGVKA